MLLVQILNSTIAKTTKLRDSSMNDERIKLVNDMVVGIRTIKSYGWENKYIKKVTEVRNNQKFYLYINNMMQTIGFNLFQNLAILAVFLIFYYQWSDGKEIDLANGFSTLAMVFYLFVTVN